MLSSSAKPYEAGKSPLEIRRTTNMDSLSPPPSLSDKSESEVPSVWGLSLPGTTVTSDDYTQTLEFILRCKGNNVAKTEKFLASTLRLLQSSKGEAFNTAESIEGTAPRDREFDAFVCDEIDDKSTTLVLLVPGQAHIIGHLIGKSGSEISKLEKKANVTIRVESKSKMPIGSADRRIYVVGSVANCVYTQQMITKRIHEKLKEEGVQQELIKIVIPHESVPHLIGKSGSNIKRLQELSGARIQVEQESILVPGTIGRSVTIQGGRFERSMAQYLTARQMAENRSTRKEWMGGVPTPVPLPGTSAFKQPNGSNSFQSNSTTGSESVYSDEGVESSVTEIPLSLFGQGTADLQGFSNHEHKTRSRQSTVFSENNFFLGGMPNSSSSIPDGAIPSATIQDSSRVHVLGQKLPRDKLVDSSGLHSSTEQKVLLYPHGILPFNTDFNSDLMPKTLWYDGQQQQSESQQQQQQQQQGHITDQNRDILFANDPLTGEPHRTDFQNSTTSQFEALVPDTAVAHLIGRSGSVISDIQRKSQTKISFARNQPFGHSATASHQKVTIIGSPYAIQIAQGLISEKIVDHLGDGFS